MNVRLKTRLWMIVGVTATSIVAMAAVDLVSQRQVEQRLTAVEQNYVPLLTLSASILERFDRLIRALQDAVGAQDLEALRATRAQRDALLASMLQAPPIVDRESIAAARGAVMQWYDLLYDISLRLIYDETGETLVADIGAMQNAQRRAADLLQRTFAFERSDLHQALASVRETQVASSWLRMSVRIGLLLVVAAATLGIGQRITRGINALAAGFDRFGADELDTSIRLTGDDELSQLAEHANQMARQLAVLRSGLQQKQAELERANEELESFSYSVSHDLKAPLRAMDGFSQAVLEDYGHALDEDGTDYLQRIRAAAQQMARLIEDMLRLSRVTRSGIHHESVDISSQAKAIAQELKATAPTRDVEFVIPEGIVVKGDGHLLRQALENLLENAWKFTGKATEPRIELGSFQQGRDVVIFVRDNGAGFDMAFADKLFGAFQRLHSAQEFAGTGIGLATVRRIAHCHEGRSWAEGAVGKGATFYVALPQTNDTHEDTASP